MFCPHKNSYLQLVCAVNPRVINKAVDRAMHLKASDLECDCYRKPPKKDGMATEVTSSHECVCIKTVAPPSADRCIDPHCEDPAAQRLVSMQPSLYAPLVDVTRAPQGFGRVGLRILNRDLHSKDKLVQLQSLHTIMDQVQISENAMFLINLQVVFRLQDLLTNLNPVIREKVCLTLTHLAGYYQGRERILSHSEIIFRLMHIIMRDKKEIRYVAAYTLRTLSRDRHACDQILHTKDIVKNLLKMIKNEHAGIVLLHLKTMENLIERDPVEPIKQNAFQIMRKLFYDKDARIVCGAMDCMAQICKHDVGKVLADDNDITFVLRPFLIIRNSEINISAAGLMSYTTLTTRSKWRAKEVIQELCLNLVRLCCISKLPLLQYRTLQVLINLCDCPDIRNYLKMRWLKKIQQIRIKTHEEWDGTMETTTMGLNLGHNYRTMCIETVETIRNDWGDTAAVINVHSYLRRLQEKKKQLIDAINWRCYL